MCECKRIAVIQRGKSGTCFPAEICEGESARSCEARVFPPSRSPFLGTLFWSVRCGVSDVFGGAMDSTVSRTPG